MCTKTDLPKVPVLAAQGIAYRSHPRFKPLQCMPEIPSKNLAGQFFIPVITMPSTKYFWHSRYTKMPGTILMQVDAMASRQSVP